MARAVIYSMGEALRYAVLTAIIIASVLYFTNVYLSVKTDARQSALQVYEASIYRATGGSIDPSDFKDSLFDEALTGEQRRFVGARMILTDLETGNEWEAFWQKGSYVRYEPLKSKSGSAASSSLSRKRYVVVLSDTGAHAGTLDTEVIVA